MQIKQTEFEHTIITKLENKEYISSEVLNQVYLELNKKYYGNSVVVEECSKYGWLFIPHFIMQESYYLYQYTIGAALGLNIATRILAHEDGFLEKYIEFQKLGNTVSIEEALKLLSINLKNGDYLENTFNYLQEKMNDIRTIRKHL